MSDKDIGSAILSTINGYLGSRPSRSATKNDSGSQNVNSGTASGSYSYSSGSDDSDKTYLPGYFKGTEDDDALNLLNATTAWNLDTLKRQGQDANDAYEQARKENESFAKLQANDWSASSNNDWWNQMLGLQSTVGTLSSQAGNMAASSYFTQGYLDALQRQDDYIDSVTRAADKENLAAINQARLQALMENNAQSNLYNTELESQMRNLGADYMVQGAAIDPEAFSGYFEDYSKGDKKSKKPAAFDLPDWLDVGDFASENFNTTEFDNPFADTRRSDEQERIEKMKRQLDFGFGENGVGSVRSNRNAEPHASASAANKRYWDNVLRGYEGTRDANRR